MANTLKKSAAQLSKLAGTGGQSEKPIEARKGGRAIKVKETVLIGAHFPRAVRRSLAQLQADPRNDGKKIKRRQKDQRPVGRSPERFIR